MSPASIEALRRLELRRLLDSHCCSCCSCCNECVRVSDRLWRVCLTVAYPVLRLWWWVRRPVAHGGYVAVWCRGRLLLVRNSYRAGETVPSGSLQRGESEREAACRELAEEVGIVTRPERLRPAGEIVVRFESKEDHAHFFELELDREPAVRIDRREVVWAAFYSRNQLWTRPLMPHVRAYLAGREPS